MHVKEVPITSPEVIALAGLVSGTLDLTATSALMRSNDVPIKRLLQTIASGAFGHSSFKQGNKTVVAGFLFHFLIAFTAAFVYYAISRRLSALIDTPLFSGVVYGSVVHLVMSRIIVPLSAAPKRDFSPKAFLTQLIIHIFCVGLPISLIVSRYS
jgi:uncharacterized membrane protein YagU involved in acid resistance